MQQEHKSVSILSPKSYDVLAIGIAAVDDLLYISSYPPPNIKIAVEAKKRYGGGPACTAIATVGTLRGRSAFCARLGGDELSQYIEQQLQTKNIDTSHIIRDCIAAPYHSTIVVDSLGNRNVFYDASKFRPLAPEDIPDSLLLSACLVLLDHVSGHVPIDVARKIRNIGIPLLCDIEGKSEPAKQLAELADYLVVPYEFARWASNAENPHEACLHLAKAGRAATVVTAGADGCYYASNRHSNVTHLPAFEVDAFDTNGCGDTFHGAFALAIAREIPLDEAILFASAAAAIKASGRNDARKGWDAIPTLEDIILLLRSSPEIPFQAGLLKNITKIATTTRL
ncbi:PfkB family carbohydrate kinase [Edaphobacter flagellatus]|uniref:PfkB family carbohydrate kinase n=1 Tax=Edaphobacter flagellatus TaxID=1933044 RepID=UPI0021B1A276|nr:PfkB family carbohydrate kinase [Edaphobacter flagellatus]